MKASNSGSSKAAAVDASHPFGVHALKLAWCGRSSVIEGQLSITTPGLLAVGGMVSSILLGAAAVVLVSTRKLPEDTLPRDL